jgi:hypothetical protein
VSWGGTRFNTLKRYEITHTKIKCWEVSRVSGISAKLERRLKRENGREGKGISYMRICTKDGFRLIQEKLSTKKFILFTLSEGQAVS